MISASNPAKNHAHLIVEKICQQMGIAYSTSLVSQLLADLEVDFGARLNLSQWNEIGRSFGFYFREVKGTYGQLLLHVNESDLIFVDRPCGFGHPEGTEPSEGFLLSLADGKYLQTFDGSSEQVSKRQLKKKLAVGRGEVFQWYVVRPVLAAERASQFRDQIPHTAQKLSPIQRYLQFIKPESQDIRAIFIFSVVIGLLSLTTPLAVEAIVNTIAFGRYFQPLIVLSFIVFIFLGFRAILSVLMTMVVEVIQRKIFLRTVEDLSRRLSRTPLAHWDKKDAPELVNRFFDVVTVQKVTSKLLLESLMLGLQTVIGLSVLAFYHPFLLGYDIGLLLLMAGILLIVGRGAIKTAKQESVNKYETASWLQCIVKNPLSFKFNGGLEFAGRRADELAASYIQNRESHFKILIRQVSFSMGMQVIAATVLLALGGYLVIIGQMTLGQLVAAELIVTVILGSFSKLGKDLEKFYDLMASIDKLGALFDLPVDSANKLSLPKVDGPCSVSMKNVKTSFDSQHAITHEISSGARCAITGTNDRERSELMEILIGQRTAANGFARLDQFRVETVSTESLQNRVSVVRDLEILNGTIEENLRLGRVNVTSDRVKDVLNELGLLKELMELPQGLLTQVSGSNYPLTKHQSILITISRALLAKPGVLMIDGTLDQLSDRDTKNLLRRLEHFSEDTTIVVSTGRESIIRWCNEEINLDEKHKFAAENPVESN